MYIHIQVIYNADQTQAILNLYNVRLQDCDLYTCLGEFRNQEETLGTQVILRGERGVHIEGFQYIEETITSCLHIMLVQEGQGME